MRVVRQCFLLSFLCMGPWTFSGWLFRVAGFGTVPIVALPRKVQARRAGCSVRFVPCCGPSSRRFCLFLVRAGGRVPCACAMCRSAFHLQDNWRACPAFSRSRGGGARRVASHRSFWHGLFSAFCSAWALGLPQAVSCVFGFAFISIFSVFMVG